MQTEIVAKLHANFEGAARHEDGITFWFARDIQALLDHARWENFEAAIERAKLSAQTSEQTMENHFREVTKMVEVGSVAWQLITGKCRVKFEEFAE